MADTANYSWTKPTVSASTDTWGVTLNTAFNDVDADLKLVSDAAAAKLAIANDLSDLNDVATARTNLGLVIGTNVQAQSATLQNVAGLTLVADRMIYATGANTFAMTPLTAAARSLLDDSSVANMRTTLNLGTAATQDIGTSGAAVPLLSAANTWTLAQAFTVVPTFNGLKAARVASGTGTNSGRISWGTAAPGTLDEGEVYLKYSA